jgi:hypothetical protein
MLLKSLLPAVCAVTLAGCTASAPVAYQPPVRLPVMVPYGWHSCPGGFCAPSPIYPLPSPAPANPPVAQSPPPAPAPEPEPYRPEPAAFEPPPLRPVDPPESYPDDSSCVGWWRICHFF